MPDSISDKESSFEFVDDTDASDGELEQVPALSSKNSNEASDDMEDRVIKPDQTVAHECISQVLKNIIAPAKTPLTATDRTLFLKVILFFQIVACVALFALFCSMIIADKNIQRLEISNRDKIIEELKNDKIYFQREVSARDQIIKNFQQRKIPAEDKIIEELEKVKRDLQEVIDRADMKDRKASFEKIKCLEDIPEELMDKWTPDESKFEGSSGFESVDQFFPKSRPVITKVSEDRMMIQLVGYNTPKVFSMEGSCIYKMWSDEDDYDYVAQVSVEEGLLYINWGGRFTPKGKKVKLVYSMPEEYL
ncbi:hypothetical protein GCK72_021506 [Caenorhabditis remanei]|uniref:Uncharacterized protein n=1 Tax=Caenorhabditis remanei TaxID=31234 RepID=A0A6A5GK14_CAERE|nr:hypothetical protein GCK72_021506 [Caenorhabditis remanei]KAF1754941.1 hypothetical protein GCK72_021506 [Caenorhabditis remanei]